MVCIKNHDHCKNELNDLSGLVGRNSMEREANAEKIIAALIPKEIRLTNPEQQELKKGKKGYAIHFASRKSPMINFYFENGNIRVLVAISIHNYCCTIGMNTATPKPQQLFRETSPLSGGTFDLLKEKVQEAIELL